MNETDASPSTPDLEPGPDSTTCSEPCGRDPDDPLERIPDGLAIDAHDDHVERGALAGQRLLRTLRRVAPGEVLTPFGARRWARVPHRMTVQISAAEHIELAPICLELINHSCDPNVFFDVERFELVALRTIEPDEELTFFYPSTEWRMESPFGCHCGSAKCHGRIDGASRMAREALAGYRLNPHIEAQLERKARAEREDRAFDLGIFLPAGEAGEDLQPA